MTGEGGGGDDRAHSCRPHPCQPDAGTLYIGVTSQPTARWWQHREGVLDGFTRRDGIKRLVHVEFFGDMEHAILREKQLKNWRREWKINLIEAANPMWRDLALDYGLDRLSK